MNAPQLPVDRVDVVLRPAQKRGGVLLGRNGGTRKFPQTDGIAGGADGSDSPIHPGARVPKQYQAGDGNEDDDPAATHADEPQKASKLRLAHGVDQEAGAWRQERATETGDQTSASLLSAFQHISPERGYSPVRGLIRGFERHRNIPIRMQKQRHLR